jgi:hypothetical protein
MCNIFVWHPDFWVITCFLSICWAIRYFHEWTNEEELRWPEKLGKKMVFNYLCILGTLYICKHEPDPTT